MHIPLTNMAALAIDYSAVFVMLLPIFTGEEDYATKFTSADDLLATCIHTPEQWGALREFVQALLNKRYAQLESAHAGEQGARKDMEDATEAAVVLGALADDAADALAAHDVAQATARYEEAKAHVASVQRSINPVSDMRSYIGEREHIASRA